MQTKTLRTDLTVVGAGLAGVFGAIAAARNGATVTLIQDRPVLGGNSSSEVRLSALGAPHSKVFTRYSREGGIAEELLLENLHRNSEGNPVLWDPLLVEWVTREPNITLLLDTAAHEVDLDDDGAIRSVTAFCSPSQTTYVCRSPLFLDASGDGILGFLAGAEFRIGREPSGEFGESMAPEHPDRKVLGSSIFFFTKRAERPVKFVPPASAVDIAATNIPELRNITDTTEGSRYWWIAYGGLLDTIYDHQEIKLHLWSLVYGIWDYIKNSGEFPAEKVDNLTLEWVGPIPGKRESRRFMGDYILRESDVIEQTVHDDAVASGGWSLDLHPPEGIYSKELPAHQVYGDGVYGIPYRCLYSRTVPNLFLAGRLVSASHSAFGSIRVMLTGGVTGQAVGTAAAICAEEGLQPRDLSFGDALQVLRQRLLRCDQYVPGAVNDDPLDHARSATVTVSSTAALTGTHKEAGARVPLDVVRGVQIPLAERLDTVAYLLDVSAPTTLRWSVWRNDRRVNYVPREEVCAGEIAVGAGDAQWIELPVGVDLAGENCWVLLEPDDAVSFHLTDESLAGVLSVARHDRPGRPEGPHWPVEDGTYAFRITPQQTVWNETNVIDGHARPYIMPHLWVSDPIEDGRSEWLQLAWDSPREVSEVRLAVNTDLNRVIYNVQHVYDESIIPHSLRDARIDVPEGDGWRTVAELRENRHRMVVLSFEAVTTDRFRVVCEATNGHDRAELYEIRACTNADGANMRHPIPAVMLAAAMLLPWPAHCDTATGAQMSAPYTQHVNPIPKSEITDWQDHRGDMSGDDVWNGDADWHSGGRTLIWDDDSYVVWLRAQWTVPNDWHGRALVLAVETRGAQQLTLDGLPIGSQHVLTAAATPGTTYRVVLRVDRGRRPGLIVRSEVVAYPSGYERWLEAQRLAGGLVTERGFLVEQWHIREEADGEGLSAPEIDHSRWPERALGEESRRGGVWWYRSRVSVPDTICGYATQGRQVQLTAFFNARGTIWVDGEQRADFARNMGHAVLAESSSNETEHAVAIRVPSSWNAWLRDTYLLTREHADAIDAQKRLSAELGLWHRFLSVRPDARFMERVLDALTPLEDVEPGDPAVGPAIERTLASLTDLRAELASAAPFVAFPYLQMPRTDGIVIRAESLFERVGTLMLTHPDGTADTYTDPAATRFHRYVLTDLEPDTEYGYSLRAGEVEMGPFTLRTAPTETVSDGRTVRIVSWGDSHYGPTILEGIINRAQEFAPDLICTSGDMIGDGINEYEWIDQLFHPTRNISPSVPIHFAVGNHDHGSWRLDDAHHDHNPYLDERFEPAVPPGASGGAPGASPYAYSIDYAGVHVIFVDPQYLEQGEGNSGLTAGSPQLEWLRRDLESARDARWKLLYVHEPVYCETWENGFYNGEEDLRRHLVPLMEEFGVDLCISGHAHTYERGIPHPPYDPETGDGNTVAYLITGGGGSQLDNRKYYEWPQIDIPPHRLQETDDIQSNDHGEYYRYHYCEIEITDNALTCIARWVRTDGSAVGELDRFVLRKGIARRGNPEDVE